MPYVIAKHKDRVGCIALRTNFGQQLVDLKRSIIAEIGYEDVELITISRPSAYGEYAPYHFLETEEDFRRDAMNLSARCP